MVIPKINSAHGSDTRNIINRAIDLINVQGKSIQDLVAKGQLTPEQYSELIRVVEGLISKGDVTLDDLSPDAIQLLTDADVNVEFLTIPRDRSVSPEKTDFIEVSKNMLDEKTLTSGKGIDATGAIVNREGINASKRTKLKPNTRYSYKGVDTIAYFDESNNFINLSTIYSLNNPITRLSPYNAHSAILNVYNQSVGSAIMNEGDSIINYEPFYQRLIDIDIDINKAIPNNSLESIKFKNGSISAEKTDFIIFPKNLINPATILRGHSINRTTGAPTPNNSVNLTDYTKVTSNQAYSVYAGADVLIGLYDENKTFLNYIYLGLDVAHTFVTDNKTTYVRIAILNNALDQARLNLGETLQPYSEYHPPKLSPDIYVAGGAGNQNTAYDTQTENYYVEDIIYKDLYTAPEIPAQYLHDVWTFQEAYALYDDLMGRHPDKITRTTETNDPDGNPVYRYDIKRKPVGDGDAKFKKVFITTGTHGHEKSAVWNAFHAIQQIVDNWESDELLESLHWNVHFIVIPILNPSGFNLHTRKNANGVDINRNMPTNHTVVSDKTAQTYGGEEPLSESETRAVYDILKNEEDIIFYVDYHNYASSDAVPQFIWNPGTSFNNNISKSLISQLTRKWKKEYDIFTSDRYVGYTSDLIDATLADEAAAFDIHAATFETSIRVYEENVEHSYSVLTAKLGVESLINYIGINLKNLIPLENRKLL